MTLFTSCPLNSPTPIIKTPNSPLTATPNEKKSSNLTHQLSSARLVLRDDALLHRLPHGREQRPRVVAPPRHHVPHVHLPVLAQNPLEVAVEGVQHVSAREVELERVLPRHALAVLEPREHVAAGARADDAVAEALLLALLGRVRGRDGAGEGLLEEALLVGVLEARRAEGLGLEQEDLGRDQAEPVAEVGEELDASSVPLAVEELVRCVVEDGSLSRVVVSSCVG